MNIKSSSFGESDADRIDLVANLTLILLLLHAPEFWYVRSPLVILSICGLIHRPVRYSPGFWLIVTGFLAASLLLNWFSSDNHKYLEAYWTLALICVFSVPEERRSQVLAANARWLLASCMLLSVFWKLISDNFLSGSFFEFTLLTDDRFEHLATWLGNVPRYDLIHNRQALHAMSMGYVDGINLDTVELQRSPRLHTLALVVTYWTIAIEGSLALLFVLPSKPPIVAARNALLLTFAMTTYLVANVQGFGWLLMILGIAQCRRQGVALLYLAGFLLIEVYNMPYGDVLTSIWTSQRGP